MTEKLSKSLLNGVGIVSGSVMGPVVNSKPGQAFLKMLPGEVLLASLDAVSKSIISLNFEYSRFYCQYLFLIRPPIHNVRTNRKFVLVLN